MTGEELDARFTRLRDDVQQAILASAAESRRHAEELAAHGRAYAEELAQGSRRDTAAQVAEAARRWMSGAGLFAHVVDAASVAPETHLLEANVAALYADLRGKPAAVVELQFTLLTAAGEIRLHRSHRREIEAASSGPEALIAAWSRGLGEILAAAESELAACPR